MYYPEKDGELMRALIEVFALDEKKARGVYQSPVGSYRDWVRALLKYARDNQGEAARSSVEAK